MKKLLVFSLLALVCFTGMPAMAQQDTAPGGGDWFCPGGGRGYGRMACATPDQCPRGLGPMGMRAKTGEPLTQEQAAKLMERYILRSRISNLKVGDIVDNGSVFEATVVTKDGAIVERIEINKETGFFRKAS